MKRAKYQFIIMIVSFVFFIGSTCLLIFTRNIDQQTEETTTLYAATVTGVEVTKIGNDISAEISVKEYSNNLLISESICKKINIDDVQHLETGQIIYFRIENFMAQHLNNAAFVNIASLKTDAKDIFSLADYNQYVHDSSYPGRILTIVAAAICLSISISYFFKIKGRKKDA